jgi:hypothetical protein
MTETGIGNVEPCTLKVDYLALPVRSQNRNAQNALEIKA